MLGVCAGGGAPKLAQARGSESEGRGPRFPNPRTNQLVTKYPREKSLGYYEAQNLGTKDKMERLDWGNGATRSCFVSGHTGRDGRRCSRARFSIHGALLAHPGGTPAGSVDAGVWTN